MNEQEAIKIIKCEIRCNENTTDYATLCGECELNRECESGIYRKLECEALKLAIAALEKQVPKKPTKKQYETDEEEPEIIECFSCPNCPDVNVRKYVNDYCTRCGQKLSWED